jgi:hypothetical protein
MYNAEPASAVSHYFGFNHILNVIKYILKYMWLAYNWFTAGTSDYWQVFILPLAEWRKGKEGEPYTQIGDVMLGDRSEGYSNSTERVWKYWEVTVKASQKTRNYSRCPKITRTKKNFRVVDVNIWKLPITIGNIVSRQYGNHGKHKDT